MRWLPCGAYYHEKTSSLLIFDRFKVQTHNRCSRNSEIVMDLNEPVAFRTVDGQSNRHPSNADSTESGFKGWLQRRIGFATAHERVVSAASWAHLTECSPAWTSWVGRTNKVSTNIQFACGVLIRGRHRLDLRVTTCLTDLPCRSIRNLHGAQIQHAS